MKQNSSSHLHAADLLRTETVPDSFRCLRCGACCKWKGLVRLTDNEIDRIAAFLQLSVRDFVNQYTILCPDRTGLSLKESADGICCFYEGEIPGCRIQPVKPGQCTAFPHHWNFPGWREECAGGKALQNCSVKSPSKIPSEDSSD